MRITAAAKINLRLVVLAREASGFHQIETIFCRIALADEIVIEPAAHTGIVLDVRGADFESAADVGPAAALGPAPDNLVVRAAHAYCAAAGIAPAFAIALHKHIPAGAGLGGGSSDAAATLRALDAMHGGCLGTAQLLDLAARLGSDVPFFIANAPIALAWGRGQRLLTHAGPGAAPALVVMPPATVATAGAYARLSEALDDAPRAAQLDANVLASWSALADVACNDFERVVLPEIPVLTQVLVSLREHGALVAQLTGSGAASFGVFDDADLRDAVADQLERVHPDVRLFRTDAAV